MRVYLDTSVVLRILLKQPEVIESWRRWDEAFASELLSVDSRRVIDRLRLGGSLDDVAVANLHDSLRTIEETLGIVRLTRSILRRAAQPMATAVSTLDAVHLATALALKDERVVDLVFATHDRQQAVSARALGFRCIGE